MPFFNSSASSAATESTTASKGRKALGILSAAALGALLLGGCSGESSAESTQPPAASAGGTTAESAPATESPLSISEPWIKAAETGMTGAFGVLANNGAEDIQVIGASSPAAASVELHETAAGADGQFAMAETADGFTVPAGGEFVLEPGANHLMLMGLTGPVLPGDEVSFTLELADGTTVDFTATAKDFSGANESYHGK